MDVDVVTDEASFRALAPEWDQLWAGAGGHYQDSFEFARLSWQHVAAAEGAELFCVVLREGGVPVLIWPLTTLKRTGLRFLRPLGPGAADATALLSRADSEGLLAVVWDDVLGSSRADVVQLPYLPAGSQLHQLGLSSGRVVADVPDLLPVAKLRGQTDWDTYRGSSARKTLGKRLRRLERLGEVHRRELVTGRDDAEFEPLVDWILEHRRRRGEVTGKAGIWLRSKGYRDFLVATLRDTNPAAPLGRLFLLELGSTPVAAVTVGSGPAIAHTQITAFDAEFAQASPGALAFEQCGRWALEQRLDLNMGPGGEPFKTNLARGYTLPTSSLTLALTRRARLGFTARGLAARGRGLAGSSTDD